MMKLIPTFFFAACIVSTLTTTANALEALSDDSLGQVQGQAGADISLKLSINQKVIKENNVERYVLDPDVCAKVEFCRLAIAVNGRYINANGEANYTEGFKLWLVFKGIQGTVNIQKLGLDGVDLTFQNYKDKPQIKAAMQLSLDATKPIEIRNFGFNALAFGQDKFVSTNTTEGTGKTNEDYGYLQVSEYNQTNAPNSYYDHRRETGFMGMKMNGNLAVEGKIMVFGCDKSHPRC